MKLAIIEAIGLAAMFFIAAAVSYNSGSVGGRVDAAANIGLAANGQDGREARRGGLADQDEGGAE